MNAGAEGPKGKVATWVRVGGMALAVLMLGFTFRNLDTLRVAEVLRGIPAFGWLLILVPQLLALGMETVGWREAFAILGQKVGFFPLFRVRFATEALAQTLPMGVVFSETVKPMLLGRLCGVSLSNALAGMAARKYLLLFSQAAYVGGMAWLGYASLEAASASVIGVGGLGRWTLATGAVLAVTALGTRWVLARGALARRLLGVLLRLPGRARNFFRERARRFEETDGALGRYFAAGARAEQPALWFFAAWLLEALETFLILRLLGVELDFRTVAAFEVALSLVRNGAVALPAGLGVQDWGYVAFLSALGVPEALSMGGAFVLLKRSKELCWSLVGFALLASEPRPAERPVST